MTHVLIETVTHVLIETVTHVLIEAVTHVPIDTVTHVLIETVTHQGWGQVQLTKYSSTPSTPNIYQVQVLVKYSFFKKVLKYIKYFHIKYKYKYKYSY